MKSSIQSAVLLSALVACAARKPTATAPPPPAPVQSDVSGYQFTFNGTPMPVEDASVFWSGAMGWMRVSLASTPQDCDRFSHRGWSGPSSDSVTSITIYPTYAPDGTVSWVPDAPQVVGPGPDDWISGRGELAGTAAIELAHPEAGFRGTLQTRSVKTDFSSGEEVLVAEFSGPLSARSCGTIWPSRNGLTPESFEGQPDVSWSLAGHELPLVSALVVPGKVMVLSSNPTECDGYENLYDGARMHLLLFLDEQNQPTGGFKMFSAHRDGQKGWQSGVVGVPDGSSLRLPALEADGEGLQIVPLEGTFDLDGYGLEISGTVRATLCSAQ